MVIKLCQDQKIPLINVVRREEQVKMLKEDYGAKYVLNSSSENFFDELRELAKELKAKSCIECIGGKFTARLMECLPSRSRMIFYGCLSE